MGAMQAGRVVEQHAHGDVAVGFAVGHAEGGYIAHQRGIEFDQPAIDQDHRGDCRDNLAAGGDAKEGFRGRRKALGLVDRPKSLSPKNALVIDQCNRDRGGLVLALGQFP